jgi:hypothetical protein
MGNREEERMVGKRATTSEHYMHADQEELIAGMRLAEERWRKE